MNWASLLDQSNNLPMIILFGLGWFSLWRKIGALEARISNIEGVMEGWLSPRPPGKDGPLTADSLRKILSRTRGPTYGARIPLPSKALMGTGE